jgi:hypothetical protein
MYHLFNVLKFLIVSAVCICMFLTINSDCFPKQLNLLGFVAEQRVYYEVRTGFLYII